MECHFSYAVLLDEDGKFLKAANRSYQVGQTVYDPVLVGDYHYRHRPPAVRIVGRVIGLLLLILAVFLCIRYCGSDTPSDSSNPAVTTGDLLTEYRAKCIALAHAGIAEDAAIFESVELDEEDGVTVYELDFIANGVEYEYELDAHTGAILQYKSEPID